MVESIINKILENFTSVNEDADTLSKNIINSETKVITAITESASGTTEQ